ncbi:SAP30-binding protein [Eurosta solidaginis]|uniref:SAP30-binding protein n=1 Tax=Eurosta solidaginis TaxID=178769 RepID=UPI00353078AF
MSRALESLTAQYTDSENEGEADDKSLDSSNSQITQMKIPQQSPKASPEKTPEKNREHKKKKRKRKRSVRRLVSYQDDTVISDDEDGDESASTDSDTSSETESEADKASVYNIPASTSRDNSNSIQIVLDDNSVEIISESKSPKKGEPPNKYAHYGFSLPPEPKGKPSAELVDKIKQLYDKMETTNMDMNRVIQGRKEFRNPSIYEKLIQYCDINEFGTNYPPEIYDPLQWGQESYYEELARIQKNEMLKRQKERKDTDKIEQATALARKVEEEAKKRKSKWDQPATAAAKSVPPTLTTTVTGTKGTVISAFGSLPKKPAA